MSEIDRLINEIRILNMSLKTFDEKLENIYIKCDKMGKHIDVVENMIEKFKPMLTGMERLFCKNQNKP